MDLIGQGSFYAIFSLHLNKKIQKSNRDRTSSTNGVYQFHDLKKENEIACMKGGHLLTSPFLSYEAFLFISEFFSPLVDFLLYEGIKYTIFINIVYGQMIHIQ